MWWSNVLAQYCCVEFTKNTYIYYDYYVKPLLKHKKDNIMRIYHLVIALLTFVESIILFMQSYEHPKQWKKYNIGYLHDAHIFSYIRPDIHTSSYDQIYEILTDKKDSLHLVMWKHLSEESQIVAALEEAWWLNSGLVIH